MRHFALSLATSVLLLGTASAQDAAIKAPSGTYKLDKTHASVTWRVNHLGLSMYTARFTEMDAVIEFDAAKPENSKVSATINPASVETDYPYPQKEDFDAKLRGEKFFEVSKYAGITFKSTKIELSGKDTGKITGDLSFLGQTKPITLDVKLNGAMEAHPMSKQPALGFSAKGIVQRSQFGMTHLLPFIGDNVEVIIEMEFQQPK